MRLYIEDEDGQRVMMLLTQPTTVLEVKRHVEQHLGVPAAQQALMFAGSELPAEALVVEDLCLDRYNMRHEATLQLRRRLAAPRSVWLTSSATDSARRQQLEAVELGGPLSDVARLLRVRGLAPAPFALGDGKGSGGPGAIVVRREDGSTTRITVGPSTTVAQLEERIREAEGRAPTTLAFLQAPDGCLHVVFGPSAGSAASPFTVYARSLAPQPPVPQRAVAHGMEPLGELAARLCVNP